VLGKLGIYTEREIKELFTLEQAKKAQWRCRGTALLFL
jgi:hypothetical protein